MENNADTPQDANDKMFEEIDLSATAPSSEVTESLKAYKEALEQEWADKNDPSNAREIAKQTKEEIAKHVPDYLVTMRGLALGAVSETVKFQATKWLLESALLPGKAGAKDTLADLLEEMDAAAKSESTS